MAVEGRVSTVVVVVVVRHQGRLHRQAYRGKKRGLGELVPRLLLGAPVVVRRKSARLIILAEESQKQGPPPLTRLSPRRLVVLVRTL